MTEKTVTAAIVTYNRLELLKESLAAILAQTKYLSHVIIVNNMSTDGTTEYLDSLNDERIVVYHATEIWVVLVVLTKQSVYLVNNYKMTLSG